MPNEHPDRPDRNVALGDRLAIAREVLGYGRAKEPGERGNQTDFATNAGLKPNRYNQYERGVNYPKAEAMEQLCARYPGLTMDYIYRASYAGMDRDLIERVQKVLDGEPLPSSSGKKTAAKQPVNVPMQVVEPRRHRA